MEGSWSYLGKVLGGQDAPKTVQDGAKTRQDRDRTAQDDAKTGQGGAKTPQDGAKTLQAGAKMVQERKDTKTLKNLKKKKVFGEALDVSGELLGTSGVIYLIGAREARGAQACSAKQTEEMQ